MNNDYRVVLAKAARNIFHGTGEQKKPPGRSRAVSV